jgi:hypothetical protein
MSEGNKAEHPTVVGEVYAHIGNGGVTFAVHDEGRFGPKIQIRSRHFGNNEITQDLLTTPQVLEELGKLFTQAAAHTYQGVYVHAASLIGEVDTEAGCGSEAVSDSEGGDPALDLP